MSNPSITAKAGKSSRTEDSESEHSELAEVGREDASQDTDAFGQETQHAEAETKANAAVALSRQAKAEGRKFQSVHASPSPAQKPISPPKEESKVRPFTTHIAETQSLLPETVNIVDNLSGMVEAGITPRIPTDDPSPKPTLDLRWIADC